MEKIETKTQVKKKIETKKNVMRAIKIEKVVLSCGGIKDVLEKEVKLLQKITKKKPLIRMTIKRIPGFAIRPKMEVGCMVTLRGKEATDLLKKLFVAIDNQLKKKQIQDNHFSFGIKEYIEIPGEEYDREIGMMGFNVTVVFSMSGKRVAIKKIKRGSLPKKQTVKKELIIKFLEKHFKIIMGK
ncbi:MAG: 50S ribosomal protein L5 [Nanoarchaeota archaeon]